VLLEQEPGDVVADHDALAALTAAGAGQQRRGSFTFETTFAGPITQTFSGNPGEHRSFTMFAVEVTTPHDLPLPPRVEVTLAFDCFADTQGPAPANRDSLRVVFAPCSRVAPATIVGLFPRGSATGVFPMGARVRGASADNVALELSFTLTGATAGSAVMFKFMGGGNIALHHLRRLFFLERRWPVTMPIPYPYPKRRL
jgi:hypothetical protein